MNYFLSISNCRRDKFKPLMIAISGVHGQVLEVFSNHFYSPGHAKCCRPIKAFLNFLLNWPGTLSQKNLAFHFPKYLSN